MKTQTRTEDAMAKILLVEDQEPMLNFLNIALTRAGHDIIMFKNGSDALAYLKDDNNAQTIDLLLTDIVVPGIDGIELAERTTEINPKTRIMFITGFAAMAMKAEQSAQTPIEKGKAKILSKPFHLNDLVDEVSALLYGNNKTPS